MSFLTVLTIVFVVLKLMGVIAWSWFFVLLPSIIFVVIWLSVVLYFHNQARRFRRFK